jgi:hypothetical protein
MGYGKEEIKTNLGTDRKWMERGVIVLYERLTEEEQQSGQTQYFNNRGFNGSDSRYLTWVAGWLLKDPRNHLNDKHKQKVGKMLPKYWKQIQDIIEKKS